MVLNPWISGRGFVEWLQILFFCKVFAIALLLPDSSQTRTQADYRVKDGRGLVGPPGGMVPESGRWRAGLP
jgi:hypothetical protein